MHEAFDEFGDSGDVTENLTELAHAALDFYQRAFPMFGALLADPHRMAAHRVAFSQHGRGPDKPVAAQAVVTALT